MTGLAHPLEDVLGAALVETPVRSRRAVEKGLDGWCWMVALVSGIGLLALITR